MLCTRGLTDRMATTRWVIMGLACIAFASQALGDTRWAVFSRVVTVVLGIVGLAIAMCFPAIASYGFWHRRRLVGNLAIDAMPAS